MKGRILYLVLLVILMMPVMPVHATEVQEELAPVVEEQQSISDDVLLEGATVTDLPTPTGLEWVEEMGAMVWDAHEDKEYRYHVKVYKEGESEPIAEEMNMGTRLLGYVSGKYEEILAEDVLDKMTSGNYYFTVQTLVDDWSWEQGAEYEGSDIAKSPIFTYNRPTKRAEKARDVKWKGTSLTYINPYGNHGRAVQFGYKSYDGSIVENSGAYSGRHDYVWFACEESEKFEEHSWEWGDGPFYGRVRIMSPNILEYLDSEWSEWVEISKEELEKALQEPDTPTPSPEPVPTPEPDVPTPTPKPDNPTPSPNWQFGDVAVNPGNWKYEAVKYVYDNKIMNGVGDGTQFDPDAPLTREMFATVLYRIAGQPAVTYKNKFPDVPGGKWYSNAVIWASEQGIVSGYTNGKFGTGDYITREQIAKMLMEYCEKQGYDISQSADFSKFADAGKVSGWANDYMKWAVGSGMIGGSQKDGKYYLNPKGNATRAESATMLKRFMEKY